MQFESERKRNFWTGYAIRLVAEYVVIYILLKMFQNEYDKSSQFFEAFIGLIILFVVEIALALKNALLTYLLYRWKGKEEGVEDMLAAFKRMNLPKPGEYYLDADGYIEEVLKDEDATLEAKSYVSIILGILTAYRSNQMMVRGFMYQSIVEETIKRYQVLCR